MRNKIIIKKNIKPFIQKFMKNTRNDLDLLKKSWDEKDFEQLKFISHSIKGYCKPFGFEDFGGLAQNIHEVAMAHEAAVEKEQYLDELKMGVTDLLTYFDNIELVFDE